MNTLRSVLERSGPTLATLAGVSVLAMGCNGSPAVEARPTPAAPAATQEGTTTQVPVPPELEPSDRFSPSPSLSPSPYPSLRPSPSGPPPLPTPEIAKWCEGLPPIRPEGDGFTYDEECRTMTSDPSGDEYSGMPAEAAGNPELEEFWLDQNAVYPGHTLNVHCANPGEGRLIIRFPAAEGVGPRDRLVQLSQPAMQALVSDPMGISSCP